MLGFLWICFTIFVLENAYLVYRFIINKPIREELAQAKAKLKTAEVINEMLNKELPTSKSGKLDRFNKLVSGDK